ncbi:MAG: prepilin-type N-terminal cleavage/methylation domain-containing protein [Phycisphaerales bacterium]|nr:prepilin-type N-terminal cleavage/methylation domain-containing protein [Phycisphaerales bacterium]
MQKLCFLTAAAIGIAGFAKLVDLAEFDNQLSSWSLLSNAPTRFSVVLGLPIIEITLCAAYVCFPARRTAVALCMLVLFVVFSLAFIIEAHDGAPPGCACFGLLFRRMEFQNDAVWVVGKNALLAVPPVLVLWTGRRRALMENVPRGNAPDIRGFTLVETLAVIAVIAVIVAILLPVLSHVRRSGRVSATLNNLRQHAGIFLLYTNDYAEQFPYFTRPEPGLSTPLVDPSGRVWNTYYFGAFHNWALALSDGYYNSTGSREGFVSPFRAESPGVSWDYLYPCVFLADPAYWRSITRMVPPIQFRSTRLHDVVFPGAKVLISDECYWESTRYTSSPFAAGGCVDGHAEQVAGYRMAQQYGPGDGDGNPLSSPYGHHGGNTNAFMHLVGGVSERDFIDK